MKRFLLVVVVVALALWVRTIFYTVDYAEFVYVTRFGERVAIHDGEADAGLKVKAPWPVDAVLRLDRRVQSFDLPAVESLTRDPVNRTERERKVAEYQTQARKRAADITTDADRAARTMEADARASKTVVEGQANAEAGRIRGSAYAQDREFYVFLEKLRSFQAMLADTRDVLLLSTKHPLFDVFRGPPTPNHK